MMDVSLIIRTRNEEDNIANCLDAVARQTKKPKEIIITDNMSSDDTLKIVQKYQKKLPIKVIMNPIIGFASGLNLGVGNSRYRYVAFLSADCTPDKNWLLKLTEFMKIKGCALVQGQEILFPDNIIHQVLAAEEPTVDGVQKILYFNYTNTLCDKSILQKFLPFQSVGKYLYGEDTLMALTYKKYNYQSFLISEAFVKHTKFTSKEEFKERVFKHARSSVSFFFKTPLHPRLYLNSMYWVLKDFMLFITKRDIKFLMVSYWRFTSTVKGTFSGLRSLLVAER